MVPKSKIWMFPGGFHRVVFVYLVLVVGLLAFQGDGLTVNAQAGPDEGALYLDQKELIVKEIAGNATLHNDNCGSLDGCSAECSRVTCYPISGESPQCFTVDNNEFYNICPIGACKNKMLVDYNRSFVILPAPASTTLSTEVARDICLQRNLESTFKTVSFPSEYSLVYFGSTSGAFRAFPGRERNETQCTSFDPRKRPWYLNGISVSKDVKILVDVANSMGSVVTVDYKRLPQTTYLDVAKNITLGLLQTFSPQDYVEVFSFDSSNATSLAGAIQISASYNYLNPAGRAELAALGASVNQLTASPDAASSNLNGAIVQAVNSFNTMDKLKVIVVLSDGHFVPLKNTTFPSLELQNLHIKLMLYKLPTNDDSGDPFLLKNPSLQENICSVNGSFERLNALETVNSLYSIRSYFTFLARTQLASVDNNATWSNLYLSFSQDRTAITVTYPAFASNGRLIGVAGLDVVIDNLNQSLQDMVYAEFFSRTRGTQAPANIPMECNYQSTPGNFVCSSSTLPDSSAICPGTNTNTLADRTCCGNDTCGSAKSTGTKKFWVKDLLLSIAVVAGTIIVVVGYFWYRSHIKTKSFSPVEVDLFDLNLCEFIVHVIVDHVNSRRFNFKRKSTQNLLNERQCRDLSSKLSKTTQNIRDIVFHCRTSSALFKPALEKLYLDLEKAKLLVIQCGEEDWCRASVFQSQNETAFQEILLDVGFCYNAIYEQARSITEERQRPEDLPEDLRKSNAFKPALQNVVCEDQKELLERLKALGNGHRVSVKQCLARYLQLKLDHTSRANALDTCSTILWAKETGLPKTWGPSRFLGSGSGASGVCSTKWMGIPCAKKEFHVKVSGPLFLNEASILAHLKHPCIVNFICCGNGELKGDRFIAMELMQKSLHDLIEDQRTVYFSLPVVVNIMVQVARGMCYLHGQRIAHRDLKPQNVVVNILTSPHLAVHFCVKLVDFGMSKTKVEVSKSNSVSVVGVGTTIYRAPEVHPKAHSSKVDWIKADVFSFAMTCAHLLSLKRPFGDASMSELYENIMAGRRPELPGDCPKELDALLKNCWDTSPRSRPSFVEICTRLEAFRYKLFRGFPTSESSLQQDGGFEFIKVKIEEHYRTCIQKPLDAISGVEDEGAMLLEETISPGFSTGGTDAPGTSMQMKQRSSRQKASSM